MADSNERYLKKVLRGIVEFNMFTHDDRVLIGLSGGKDSLFLLHVMKRLEKELPFSIKPAALTVDLGFEGSSYEEGILLDLKNYCQHLDIPHYFIKTHIAEHAFKGDGRNPCATCSYFRRAVMSKFAQEKGFNKIALGHHIDDAVETFLLNLFYNGKLKTMAPVRFMDRSSITIVRPLIYLRESEIEETLSLMGLKPLRSPCPIAGTTKRVAIKELLKGDEDLVSNIVGAMRTPEESLELWPKEPQRHQIWQLFKEFWSK
jgi:tRNA 2-thiocytidine biosynthesis protein TtcA